MAARNVPAALNSSTGSIFGRAPIADRQPRNIDPEIESDRAGQHHRHDESERAEQRDFGLRQLCRDERAAHRAGHRQAAALDDMQRPGDQIIVVHCACFARSTSRTSRSLRECAECFDGLRRRSDERKQARAGTWAASIRTRRSLVGRCGAASLIDVAHDQPRRHRLAASGDRPRRSGYRRSDA